MVNINSIKKSYTYENIIKKAIDVFNNFIDELELSYSLCSYEDLIYYSKYSNKILYKEYDLEKESNNLIVFKNKNDRFKIYIGVNLIHWVDGKISINEVYLNKNDNEIYINRKTERYYNNESEILIK